MAKIYLILKFISLLGLGLIGIIVIAAIFIKVLEWQDGH